MLESSSWFESFNLATFSPAHLRRFSGLPLELIADHGIIFIKQSTRDGEVFNKFWADRDVFAVTARSTIDDPAVSAPKSFPV